MEGLQKSLAFLNNSDNLFSYEIETQRHPKRLSGSSFEKNQKANDRVTCGNCELSWDDAKPTSLTPAPSARCPFEYFHKD